MVGQIYNSVSKVCFHIFIPAAKSGDVQKSVSLPCLALRLLAVGLVAQNISLCVMPPKKKARTSGPKAVAMGTMDDVSPLQVKVKDFIARAYSVRHGTSEELPWPLGHGGSLLQICQRCWNDPGCLLAGSLSLLKKMGLMQDLAAIPDFCSEYMTTKDHF